MPLRGNAVPRQLSSWRDRRIVAVALVALAAGYGQFGAVAALGDVAKVFGHVTQGATVADQAGLSGSSLGIGLAVIRLASLAALPLTSLADRFGRRTSLLVATAAGLALTALAATSPSYWIFVIIFALGRPLLSTTNALAQVTVAEQTASANRSKAVALATAGYGVGAGLTAIVHGLWVHGSGFRWLFASAVLPFVLLVALRGSIKETDRYEMAASAGHETPVLGVVGSALRARLAVVAGVAFFVAVISGPGTSFVFLYAENVVRQRGYITSLMVVGAGAAGLVGLLAGRYLSDRLGRRPTIAIAIVALACFSALAYSGTKSALVVGYILGVGAGSVLAPAIGSLTNELFPTSVRASAAGWVVAAAVLGAVVGLVVFGYVVDVGNSFAFAALLTFLPVSLAGALSFAVPETKGKEPEEL